MQPHKKSLFELFDSRKRYVVPLFQRQYVWSLEEQWIPLWEDIQRKFAERLNNGSGPPHFLGAMVIERRATLGSALPANLVVDGQQRLTTFQIFLAAFRDVCITLDQQEYAEECERHLINSGGVMANPDEEKYKVWPTNLDRNQFRDVIDSRSKAELEKRHPLIREKYARKPNPRPLMIECYFFFHERLTQLLKEENLETTAKTKVIKLFEALRNSLQVVTIELDDDDDPQVIFETLNARGEPLLPSDLLRNFVFWRASQNDESQEDLYNTYWLAFDDQFWRKEEKQGRLNRPRSDMFLQHYLSLKRRAEISIGHLFAEYKYWISNYTPFTSVRDELVEMERHRGFFRQLVEPDESTSVGRLARTLQVLEIRTIYPLVLGILERQDDASDLDGIFADLESYVVRRAICNLGTKNYNRLFLSILSKLPLTGISREILRNILLEQGGESNIWPNDDEFQKAWLNNPAYENLTATRVQWVLQQIEDKLKPKPSECLGIKQSLFVEHILPQEWVAEWPLENGKPGVRWFERLNADAERDDMELSATRDLIKHTFGNLTLVTKPLNLSVSNSAFDQKRVELLDNSVLAINRYFQDVLVWNEDEIRRRGQQLFTVAREMWPYGR